MNTPAMTKKPFVFNPLALPFLPVYTDKHCLFITFSNGFALTESQIFLFFVSMYGLYVADVYVHKPRPVGKEVKPSLFGKVMFKHFLIPELVMGNNERVCFNVDGFPIYCRRFVNQKTNQTATTEAGSTSRPDGGSHDGGDE